MQMIRCAAVLLACLAGCSALCGCAAGTSGEDSGSGLWLGIEPAKEDEFGKVTYADGIYLSQNVQEPVPDPYADDTEEKETGETGDGLRYTLYQRHAEITGHADSFELEELDIPAEIGGLPVTRASGRSGSMHFTAARIYRRSRCRNRSWRSVRTPFRCAPR